MKGAQNGAQAFQKHLRHFRLRLHFYQFSSVDRDAKHMLISQTKFLLTIHRKIVNICPIFLLPRLEDAFSLTSKLRHISSCETRTKDPPVFLQASAGCTFDANNLLSGYRDLLFGNLAGFSTIEACQTPQLWQN